MRKRQLLLTVLLTSNVYVDGFIVPQNYRKGCMFTKLNVAAAETISELNVQAKISNELTPEQESFFASLDVQVYGIPFIERARDLQKFKNEFGSCRVPKRYSANPTLGKQSSAMCTSIFNKVNSFQSSFLLNLDRKLGK